MRDYNIKWDEYFRLDENSLSGILRINSKYKKCINRTTVGTKHFRKNGKAHCWILKHNNQVYYIHRIIWVLKYGSISPDLVIDHIDGNPFNNSIENLSLKTQKDNTRNRRMRSDNKTGITGVKFEIIKDRAYYQANWKELDGTQSIKYFSVDTLGDIKAKELAIEYRNQQIERLIKEGADYTKQHGKVF